MLLVHCWSGGGGGRWSIVSVLLHNATHRAGVWCAAKPVRSAPSDGVCSRANQREAGFKANARKRQGLPKTGASLAEGEFIFLLPFKQRPIEGFLLNIAALDQDLTEQRRLTAALALGLVSQGLV